MAPVAAQTSLTENLMMVGMALWMILKPMGMGQ
jgi:hypothetical protein